MPASTHWIIDGNNVFGSRPDGWWNDREAAATRFAQQVAEWCRTHDDDVVVVFDSPVGSSTAMLAGGNLRIVGSDRRGRDAADDTIVRLATETVTTDALDVRVVSSDRGLRRRLPVTVRAVGAGGFLAHIEGAAG